MDSIISVKNLKKYYQVAQRQSGFLGALKSFVSREYKDVKAVDDISFTIQEGELIGFIGPNGAGKTTTLKVLSGLLYPTSGEVKIAGFEPSKRDTELLKKISLVMGQKNQLWWELPAIDTFELNRAIYEIPEKVYKKILNDLSSILQVGGLFNTPVRKLSLGERMKMELIASLLHNPKILFLDEPTIGLDVVMQKTLRDFIKQYNNEFGATIILTSHYMADVRELAKRVLIIDSGKIIYDGMLQNVVQKYSKNKTVKIVFIREIKRTDLEEYGKILAWEPPQVILSVPQDSAALVVSQILKNFAIADLTIEDISIEDVIRKIFTGKKS